MKRYPASLLALSAIGMYAVMLSHRIAMIKRDPLKANAPKNTGVQIVFAVICIKVIMESVANHYKKEISNSIEVFHHTRMWKDTEYD